MKTLQQVLLNKKNQGIISITPNRSVYDALVILAEYKIGALAVIKDGELVGILSERDYAREVVLKGRSSQTTLVGEVMTSPVITAKADDTVETAMDIMLEKRIRHLPVVDQGKMLGMLSIGDVLKETISQQKELIRQLESYIHS